MTDTASKDKKVETLTLGALLRDHRKQKGSSLEDVAQETRISLPVLAAIEADNYERMPAMAFCRGFYVLYANYLGLDAKSILRQYEHTMPQQGETFTKQDPPVHRSRSFNSFLEPSNIAHVSSRAFVLIVFLFTVTGSCIFFNWNPMQYFIDTFLAQSKQVEKKEKTHTPGSVPLTVADTSNNDTNDTSVEDISTTKAMTAPYKLEISFVNSGILEATLDNGPTLDREFTAGSTLQFQIEETILLDMPESVAGTLRLNGMEFPLPKAENGRRRLSIPEGLLD